MNFHVDTDSGSIISGWVIPDNPGDVPELIIRSPGFADTILRANVLRPDLRELGMHSSGLAGFHVDEQLAPGLSQRTDVSLLDVATGIQIYRRFDPDMHLDRKLLLFDASLVPQINIIKEIMARFSLSYPIVERLSMETVTSVIYHNYANSILVSGRPNWIRNGSGFREKRFVCAALLAEPFEELAEKLVLLTMATTKASAFQGHPSIGPYLETLPFVAEMDLRDERTVLAAFRRMPLNLRKLFQSPMTRALGAAPEDDIQRKHVSASLDNLAMFDVVGLKNRYQEFAGMLDGIIGASIFSELKTVSLPGVEGLSERLENIGLLADLLDEDIALYSFAVEAVRAGCADSGVVSSEDSNTKE